VSVDAQHELEIGRQFARCARNHGYPNFPDPVLNGDKLDYPGSGHEVKDQMAAVMQTPECKAVMDQLQALLDPTTRAPSTADMQKLKQFAACMRDHGIPEFPDPKADGSFPIAGTPLENEGRSARVLAGEDACKQFAQVKDGKVAVS